MQSFESFLRSAVTSKHSTVQLIGAIPVIRHIWENRIVAIAPDCKSGGLGLHWFESNFSHAWMFSSAG